LSAGWSAAAEVSRSAVRMLRSFIALLWGD
jgi:hypothetical protein